MVVRRKRCAHRTREGRAWRPRFKREFHGGAQMSAPRLPVRAFIPLCAGVLAAWLVMARPAQAGYRIENVTYPSEIRGGISAVTFTPAGTLVIATRYGEVWMRSTSGRWHRFARGLNEPMGLVAESETVVYIAHRPELLRASDTNGDGEADTFDALGGRWGLSQNYHEFFFGLKRDREGDFYGAVSLESTGANSEDQKAVVPLTPKRGARNPDTVLEGTFHRSDLQWHGWAVRITPD